MHVLKSMEALLYMINMIKFKIFSRIVKNSEKWNFNFKLNQVEKATTTKNLILC